MKVILHCFRNTRLAYNDIQCTWHDVDGRVHAQVQAAVHDCAAPANYKTQQRHDGYFVDVFVDIVPRGVPADTIQAVVLVVVEHIDTANTNTTRYLS